MPDVDALLQEAEAAPDLDTAAAATVLAVERLLSPRATSPAPGGALELHGTTSTAAAGAQPDIRVVGVQGGIGGALQAHWVPVGSYAPSSTGTSPPESRRTSLEVGRERERHYAPMRHAPHGQAAPSFLTPGYHTRIPDIGPWQYDHTSTAEDGGHSRGAVQHSAPRFAQRSPSPLGARRGRLSGSSPHTGAASTRDALLSSSPSPPLARDRSRASVGLNRLMSSAGFTPSPGTRRLLSQGVALPDFLARQDALLARRQAFVEAQVRGWQGGSGRLGPDG